MPLDAAVPGAVPGDQIPLTPEAITPDWLSDALAARFPGVQATRVEVVEAHAGTTGRARLRVGYGRAAGAPAAIFAKLPPGDPGQREMVRATGMGRREARFYASLADEVPLRVPGVLASQWSEDGTRYLMLLEDLEASGCRFPRPDDSGVLDYARDLADSLARLHARFWNSERFAGDLAWVEPAPRSPLGPALVKRALADFASQLPPAFGRIGRIYVDCSEGVCDLWDQGEATLVHGDGHMGNLFLDSRTPGATTVGFLDWACLSRTPGQRDLSYWLANSLPPELRRREEADLIRRYLGGLAAQGVSAPDFETAWRRHRLHVAYAWVAAAVTLAMGDRWQSVAVGRAGVERSTAAVAELASAELFAEALGLAQESGRFG